VEVPDALIAAARLTALMLFLFLAAVWLALVLWTARDVTQRTNDPVARLLAVVVVGGLFVAGYVIYRLLRPARTLQQRYFDSLEEEALLQGLQATPACGACGRATHESFVFCPFCKSQLRTRCDGCGTAIEKAWPLCAYCGLERGATPRRQEIPAAVAAAG
jgi:hypothetical protein